MVQSARQLGISRDGLVIALMTALQESQLWMYANDSVPESLAYPHDRVGHDHDSVNLFQQRSAAGWGQRRRADGSDLRCSRVLRRSNRP